jgi:serine/threonine protein kinase/type II secretory pathway pseudopilin PulG
MADREPFGPETDFENDVTSGEPAVPTGGGLPHIEAPAQVGSQIGPYRVRSILGEGGFGVVYLAEQSQPVRRRVALKVIKPGMDSKAVLARFEAERQALAVMDHPCVAKVHDGGTTERGLPYFVMEVVEGDPLTTFCDRNRLTIAERVELFIRVCDAVQHAHTKGVIHRDLKPSNILVAYDGDGKPQPKVIDFGVAKALNQQLTDSTLFTQQGQLIGTPEYMSPEQAEMGATGIDTRTDVYSLGVLLYELLTGQRPFELKQAIFSEMQRLIREVEPPKPSTRLTSIDDAPRVAAARRTDLRVLPRRLRGDLDWVVMKCLEKQRERRYDTPNALSMELRRYLNDEPVLAGPPSASYRLGKFVKRNRVGVTAASIVAVAIIGGAAAAVVGFVRAEEKAAEARYEAAVAQQVRDFLSGMLRAADPNNARGAEVTVREALEAAAAELDEGDVAFDSPEVEAEIRRSIGNTYTNLGLHEEGLDQLRRGVELLGGFDADASPLVGSMLSDYAHITWLLGRLEESERVNRRVLAISRELFGDAHPRVSSAMNNLATTLADMGKSAEAAAILREAIEIEQRVGDVPMVQVLRTKNNLASVLNDLGDYAGAAELHREVLALRREHLGPDHPGVGTSLNNLGFSLYRLGDYDQAIDAFKGSIELKRRIYEPSHVEIGFSLMNLAGVLIKSGRAAEGLSLAEEATSIFATSSGRNSWTFASAQSIEGSCLAHVGRYEEAERKLLESHRVSSEALGSDHSRTKSIAGRLAEMYELWGDQKAAAQWRVSSGATS